MGVNRRKSRIFTTKAQSEASRRNGRAGGRPVEPCISGHRWRKTVEWELGKAVRKCPICTATPPRISSVTSFWRRYYPEQWKEYVLEGGQLVHYSVSARKGTQLCETNTEDEQAALDASLVAAIINTLGRTLDEFEGITCGQIGKWASYL